MAINYISLSNSQTNRYYFVLFTLNADLFMGADLFVLFYPKPVYIYPIKGNDKFDDNQRKNIN